MPASSSLTDAELLERAARRQLGLEALHEAQAMRVAYDELHAMRRGGPER